MATPAHPVARAPGHDAVSDAAPSNGTTSRRGAALVAGPLQRLVVLVLLVIGVARAGGPMAGVGARIPSNPASLGQAAPGPSGPSATTDFVSVPPSVPVVIAVLANDSDPDGT